MSALCDEVSTTCVSRWVKEASSIHSLTRTVLTLFPSELRFPFIHVSVQSFLRIFRLKELLLQFAFERQSRLKRYLGTRLHRAFDATDCARGFVWSRKLARVFRNLLHKIRPFVGI